MERDELISSIEQKLRSLRSCDTQATAVAWMSSAYKLMEEAVEQLKQQPLMSPPEIHVREKIIYIPERPTLQIVQNLPKKLPIAGQSFFDSRIPTVVYPEKFLPPGLKPFPKAWTRADTLRLESAIKSSRKLQKRGR